MPGRTPESHPAPPGMPLHDGVQSDVHARSSACARASTCRALAVAAFLMALPGVGSGAITSAPPATQPELPQKAQAIVRPLVAHPSRTIVLSPPDDSARATLKAANGAGTRRGKGRPLEIGIGRAPPLAERDMRGGDLAWTVLPDGGRAARIDLTSQGAAAVRIGIAMAATHPDIALRFAGSAPGAGIFGPLPANAVAEAAARDGMYWSPVLEGSTASLEVYVPAGLAPDALALSIVRVSHLLMAGAALGRPTAKDLSDIGASEPCEIDVACVASTMPAVASTRRSVAQLVFTKESGRSFNCDGTLLSDSVQSLTPYLYTASHCMDSQTAATTLNTYWFFDAQACGSRDPPAYVLLSGGAMLLGRSEDDDWAIVRLRASPPAGAQFAAWRAEPLVAGATAFTLHHPQGDLLKWTTGTSTGIQPRESITSFVGSYVTMQWSQGSTEAGSSGAALFTPGPGGTFGELRGGLYGGDAFCSNRAGLDYFSRIEKALPLMRQYLTPNAVPAGGVVPVVEFYNRSLDHYFITAAPAEINDLDTGVHRGWERTGFRFLAYASAQAAPADANPVCRFYLRPEFGDSHFYSADPLECEQTAQRFGDAWVFESQNVFYVQLPDRASGACPLNTHAVYRFFNSPRTNHRYTAEVDLRDRLRDLPGYVAEGYGPDAVILCSPNG